MLVFDFGHLDCIDGNRIGTSAWLESTQDIPANDLAVCWLYQLPGKR
jgi:hypothetical protein